MRATFLPLAVKGAAMDIAEALPGFLSGPASFDRAWFISSMYRRMAVGFLLLSGVPDDFFEHLFKSARVFLHFLQAVTATEKATSKAGSPWFDAVACGDDQGARLIAQSSRDSWNPEKEYEDDFLFVHVLMQRFSLGAPNGALRSMLGRYEHVLEGAADVRFDLCKSLIEADQRSFDSSIELFIEREIDRSDELMRRERLSPDEAATGVHVSTELLACLRLGGEAGLRTGKNYRLAPEPARMLHRARFPAPDAWKQIERYTDILP